MDGGRVGLIRYIFLLTDGSGGYGDYNALINEAKEKGVAIYAIGLGNGVNTTLLTTIAKGTGGKYVHANNAGELQAVFEGISGDITDYNKDTDGDIL